MLIRILKWFQGFLLVRIRGYSPERFINLCSARNILIWDLKQVEDGYRFYISLKGFRELRPIVRKTKTRPIILKRFGFPFFLHRYRKRKIFVLGTLICCTIIYCLSLYIWEISITGELKHTDEAILKFLEDEDIFTGVKKSKVDCPRIEEAIRAKYPDIGWVSAEIRGTRLLLKIKETNMPEKAEVITEPSHIVAKKDGLILSIITRSGIPMVKKGSVVKKGTILVSGVVPIVGDFDVLIQKEPVVADADVVMKTYYDYKDVIQMKYNKKIYTGREKKSYGIAIKENKIFLTSPLKVYDKYDIIVNDDKLRIGRNLYLPASFITTYYKEYKIVPSVYTKEEVAELSKQRLERYLKELTNQGVTIIENKVTMKMSGSTCTTSGKIIVEEEAIAFQKINDSEWRNIETDEHSGDDD